MHHRIAIIAAGFLLVLGATQAGASLVTPTCTTFTGVNGTTTLPGTFVGTVGFGAGQVCQIGDISSNNVSTTGTFVNNSQTRSVYEFYWAGGSLLIQERLGNNGIGAAVDVELDALASSSSTSPKSILSSIQIPFQAGPTSYFTVANELLAAGYYSIDTYLSTGNNEDPTFQIAFARGAAVPEPATAALELAALGGLIAARRRGRKQAPSLRSAAGIS